MDAESGDTKAALDWLRTVLADYQFDVAGVAQLSDDAMPWPVTFTDAEDLRRHLESSGQLMPLPKEPAALANILEQSLLEFLEARALADGVSDFVRGTDRGYPDLEVRTDRFGARPHAIDIKVARRAYVKSPTTTQSRITLYTGNTYFKYPNLHWPGTPRPFQDYASHLDVILVYTFVEDSISHVSAPEIHVHEAWRIGSKQRSSTTREYLGAVVNLNDLRDGRGEFESAEAFYAYWRKFPFKLSAQVAKQLAALVEKQQAQIDARD